jgi:alanine racemase
VSRGTQAVINFENLRHNFKVLSDLAPNKLVLVVKADAYGHGLKQVVLALGVVDCFAVATIDEALIVRKYRPKVKVLLLEGFLNSYELRIAYENNFDSVVHQQQQLDLLDELQSTTKPDKKMTVWLKYDSGMNRLGFTDTEFTQALEKLEAHKNIKELILMSHLASANLRQSNFTTQQTKKFLKYKGHHHVSLSNSSALLNKDNLEDEWCRVGLALFGVSPIETTMASDYQLKPVMTLKTNVIAIKQIKSGESIGYSQTYTASTNMQVAIIGIGYGDGYPWSLSKAAYAKIKGKEANIVGRVSMDMMAIDITDIMHETPVNIGDSVLIWGDDNVSHLPLEIVANHAYTIPYVLLCQITSRVHYVYNN